ncbi:MAG: hypothetical protein NVV63_02415 [Opitutus sp.]|nr:hypothetical protein [Opitutus sp.]
MPATTILAGESSIVLDNGAILTTSSSTAEKVVVQKDGALIFWSGTKVTLKPGFRAKPESFFWAAVDRDMNGFSDQEEITDSDGDGIPDAWETVNGLNPADYSDGFADRNGDGVVNLLEYFATIAPRAGATLPSEAQVVLRTPSGQYFAVKTGTWALSPIMTP